MAKRITKKRKSKPITKTMIDKIASDLKACKLAFQQVNIPWVITDGIVLGYARYNNIMPWDTDLDMGIFVELSEKQWNDLYISLSRNGFRIKRNQRNDFIYGVRQSKFNMWSFHKKDDYYEAYPNTTKGFKFIEKAEWYDKPQMTKFLGDKYPMPNNIDDYLTCRYGQNWKDHVNKSHDNFFKEKRGDPKNISEWVTNRIRKEDGKFWWPIIMRTGENTKAVIKGES